MSERTYLDTSDGMAVYAELHGAKRDVHGWYVEGEVPNDLIGLIPKTPNKSVHIVAPLCPRCGAHTIIRKSKAGNDFWGCSRYPTCLGTVDAVDHLETLASEKLKTPVDFLRTADMATEASSGTGKSSSMSAMLRLRIEQIVALAQQKHRRDKDVEKWLSSPKFALKGRTPLQVMVTVDGCLEVENLLLSMPNAE